MWVQRATGGGSESIQMATSLDEHVTKACCCVQVHLVDMYVVARYNEGQYQQLDTYETEVPKDVVQLDPGAKVAIMTR